MPGGAIGTSMGYGYAGSYARMPDSIIMNRVVKATDEDEIPFGGAVVLNTDNTYSAFGASDTMTNFAGIAIREVKQALVYTTGASGYAPGDPCDVIERGNVAVKCVHGTPTARGKVYIRIATNEDFPTEEVGDLRADADITEGTPDVVRTLELTNCKWTTGLIGADKITELTILTRNNP